jgi:hypothetical protein
VRENAIEPEDANRAIMGVAVYTYKHDKICA